MINGTMGVGKTTTCLELQKILPQSVFLDGDWCWHMLPFVVNDETKEMVMDNIVHLLNNFLKCTIFENIIFCWVMHNQSIIDEIVSRINTDKCNQHYFTLMCSENALRERINSDITKGKRNADILTSALSRLAHYNNQRTVKIDVSNIPADMVAEKIRIEIDGC